MIGEALDYISGSLDKPGRAVRGLMAGKPREGLAALPFSDSLGITDYKQHTSGRDLTDQWGITNKHDKGWGSWGAGLGAEIATDPLNLIPGGMLGHALKDTKFARAGKSALGRFAGDELGALGLPHDLAEHPPSGMLRSSPEWVNNKTFYHGSGTPGLAAHAIDPMKTAPDNLFGRGLYTTADTSLAREYADKGVEDAGHILSRSLADSPFWNESMRRASQGEFDEFLRKHQVGVGFMKDVADIRPSEKRNVMSNLTQSHLGGGVRYADPIKQERAKEAASLFAPHLRAPEPALYQMQSGFGKILDLEAQMPHKEYSGLFDAMEPVARNVRSGVNTSSLASLLGRDNMRRFSGAIPTGQSQSPDRLIQALINIQNNDFTHEPIDFMLKGLREHGYDAMTHTGGLVTGNPIKHQVVIGLDPNDVLGMGRRTPYQRFERMDH